MNNVKNILKASAISAFVVPAMGIAAHMIPNKGRFFLDDSNLMHRFECAYSLNPNVGHNHYLSREYIEHPTDNSIRDIQEFDDGSWVSPGPDMDVHYNMENYSVTPAVIYPLHALVALIAYTALRRREMRAQSNAFMQQNER